MIKTKFEEISKLLDCNYDYKEERHLSLLSRNIPISFHKINLEYNSIKIELLYEFGENNLALINSRIQTNKNLPSFIVNTRTQFQRLFSKEKNPFTVKSTDPLFESFIMNALEECSYNEIAMNTTFEPEIKGEYNENYYYITTKFYLGFKDKEESILPSINLYKKIIDKILR